MTQRIGIEELPDMAHARPDALPVVDVRTPAEFTQGHIPGAFNIPLFTNEERVRVGITYKQEGREPAILLGFELVGPKWAGFIRQALEIAPHKRIAVHCWRGGMRSAAMAWALDLYGFEVFSIQGGYKSYRRWVLRKLEMPCILRVVGGMTGSGKTRVLTELGRLGQQVVDLEDLARHQGSSYGSLNRLVQPTQEQFENDLAARLATLDSSRPIWIEDESRNIGKCQLSSSLWEQIRGAEIFDLQIPTGLRIQYLVEEYGSLNKDFLVECTDRIRKRLGPEQTKQAIEAIGEDRMEDFVRLVLTYYDKAYRRGLATREADRIIPVPAEGADPLVNAHHLLDAARQAETARQSSATLNSINA